MLLLRSPETRPDPLGDGGGCGLALLVCLSLSTLLSNSLPLLLSIDRFGSASGCGSLSRKVGDTGVSGACACADCRSFVGWLSAGAPGEGGGRRCEECECEEYELLGRLAGAPCCGSCELCGWELGSSNTAPKVRAAVAWPVVGLRLSRFSSLKRLLRCGRRSGLVLLAGGEVVVGAVGWRFWGVVGREKLRTCRGELPVEEAGETGRRYGLVCGERDEFEGLRWCCCGCWACWAGVFCCE